MGLGRSLTVENSLENSGAREAVLAAKFEPLPTQSQRSMPFSSAPVQPAGIAFRRPRVR